MKEKTKDSFVCTLEQVHRYCTCDPIKKPTHCAKCGWEKTEAERRSHLPLVEQEDGTRRMIITRGEANA